MTISKLHLWISITLTGSLALPVCAQDIPTLQFPMDRESATHVQSSIELRARPDAFAALLDMQQTIFQQFELPDGRRVDLDLQRLDFDLQTLGVLVNGRPERFDSGDLTLWSGQVLGEANSDVFLAFSSYGSNGWIYSQGSYSHLIAYAAEGNDWSHARAHLVSEELMIELGGNRPNLCSNTQQQSSTVEPRANPGSAPSTGSTTFVPKAGPAYGLGITLECKIAVETDYEYYQQWNDLTACQNYTASLLGAISGRFQSQMNVDLTYPYLQFYTSNNDPWTAQPGGSFAMLDQFVQAWAGNIPANANLGHFMSGVDLGGALGYLQVLCNDSFGFAVTGGLTGGTTFPVTQGSNTWDFYAMSHEIGHNFGTPHTHDYCPPLDRCSVANCQNTRQCISNGTIMSYCPTCPGGMNNVRLYFHPTVVTEIRNYAVRSCLSGPCWDWAEPNDDCSQSVGITSGLYEDLGVCDTDSDFYHVSVLPDHVLSIDLSFIHANGNVDCRLWDQTCSTVLQESNSNTDGESVTWTHTGTSPATFTLEVTLTSGTSNDYTLFSAAQQHRCSNESDDGLEDNDTCASAVGLTDGSYPGLFVSDSDADYYEICVSAGRTLNVDALFNHNDADIDIFLYEPSLCGGGASTSLANSQSNSDNEALFWTNMGSSNVKVVLQVQVPSSGSQECNSYDLVIAGSNGFCGGAQAQGIIYCSPAKLNSSGLSAGIQAFGSNVPASNALTLTTTGLPFNEIGYYLTSRTQGYVANPGGSMGDLCVLGNLGRLSSQTQNSGWFSEITITVNLSDLPTNPHQPVLAGQTWNFQLWHRDGSSSNFSDAVSILYQ